MGTNCYIVENEATRECVVIDPGVYSDKIREHLKGGGLKTVAVLLTHGHFDHIMGLQKLLKDFPVPVYAYRAEAELLADKRLNMSALVTLGRGYVFTGAKYVSDNEVLELAGIRFRVLHTPGHTAGSCCYYVEDENVLFSGDTLFRGSAGRTDFPTGDAEALKASIRERLYTLPEATKVYPGHREATDIASEKAGGFYSPAGE